MSETLRQQNRYRSRALLLLVLLLVCVSVFFGAVFSNVYATGSVSGAQAVGAAWEAKRASMTVPDEKTVSMTDFYYDVLEKNHSSDSFAAYADTTILISNAQELMMFSYACSGYLYSSTSSVVDALGTFMRAADVKLGNNIDYTADFTFVNGSTTVALKSERESGNGYYSNAVYDGYGKDGSTVSRMFLPIVNFQGTFDGQGFEIRNLVVWSGSAINNGAYDAFFVRTMSGAVVTDFGLVDTTFSSDDNLHPDSGTGAKIASVVGVNGGTLSNVYALGTKVDGKAHADNIPTVGENAAGGVASQYYTAENANGTAGDDSGEVHDETTGWFTSASKRNGYFEKTYAAYPKRVGLEVKGAVYTVSTAAQFVEYTNIYKENTAAISAEITNDIDFSFIGEKAIIPMETMLSDAKVTSTLYSVAADESVAAAGGYTLTNMRITSYIRYAGGSFDWHAYGLYASTTNATGDAVQVYNLNFLQCSVEIEQSEIYSVRIAAGLIIGGARTISVDINNVMSHSYVGAGTVREVQGNRIVKENSYFTNTISIGGFVGMTDLSSILVMKNCAVTGVAGSGKFRFSMASGGNKTNYVGGFVGLELTGAAASVGAQYTDAYMGGQVNNFTIAEYTGQTSYEALRTYMGFIAGQSKTYNDAGGQTALDGIYVAPAASLSVHPAGSAANNVDAYVGGLIGGARPNANATSGVLINAEQVRIEGTIRLGGTAAVNPSYRLTYGGLIGAGTQNLNLGSASNTIKLSDMLAGNVFLDDLGSNSANLFYGGLMGNAGGATVKNMVSDGAVSLNTPFQTVNAGGMTASGKSILVSCVNTGDVTVQTDTDAAGKAQSVLAFGLAYSAQATDCINVGDVTVVAKGATNKTSANISGIAYGDAQKVTSGKNGGVLTFTDAYTFGTNPVAGTARAGANYISGIVYGGTMPSDAYNGAVTYEGVVYQAQLKIDGRFTVADDQFLSGISYGAGAADSRNDAPLTLTARADFAGKLIFTGISRQGAVSGSTNTAAGTFTTATQNGAVLRGNVYFSGITNSGSANVSENNADMRAPVTSGTVYMGGVSSDSVAVIKDNVNNGAITVSGTTAPVYAGGILGVAGGTLASNVNKGAVTLENHSGAVWAGGVAGQLKSAAASGNRSEGAVSMRGTSANNTNLGGVYGEVTAAGKTVGAQNTAVTAVLSVTKSSGELAVGGIAGRSAGAISDAVNGGNVDVSVDASAVYAAGIAGLSGALTNCVNKGDVTLSGGSATLNGRPYAAGGLAGRQSSAGDVADCANYGAVTLNAAYTTSKEINHFAGGLIAQSYTAAGYKVSRSFNYGDVKVLGKNNAGAIRAGGILGAYSASGSVTLSETFNGGAVEADASAGNLSAAGGLIGGRVGTGASTTRIEGSVNAGQVTASGSLSESYAGGLIGAPGTASGYTSVYDSANNAAVSSVAYGGGIAGGVTAAGLSVNSALNYGAVSAATAGGIVGYVGAGASLNADAAANYGTVSGSAYAAGIAGSSASSVTLNLFNVINYGEITGSGSRFALAGDGKYSVRLGIHVEGAAQVNTLIGGTATLSRVYYGTAAGASGAPAGVTAIKTTSDAGGLYAGDFVIGAGEKEEAYYGASYFSTGVLAWSEKPYLTSSGTYHSPLITAQNPYLFAVSVSSGRQSGKYVGDNFDTIAAAVAAADLSAADKTAFTNAVADTKQISLSRDNFYYDPYIGTENETKIIFKDSAKTGGADYQNLDAAIYNGNDTFTTIVYTTSAYYVNNLALGNFIYKGSNTDLALPASETGGKFDALLNVFSANAKIANFKAESVTDLDTSNRTASFQIAKVTFDVYQGDACPAGDSLYKRTFTVNVYFVDTEPSVEVASSTPSASDRGAYLTQSQGVNGKPTGFYNLAYDETVNGAEKNYALKYDASSLPADRTAGETATVDWDRGTLKITLNLQAFSESAASNVTVSLYRKGQNDADYALLGADYAGVYYRAAVSAPRDNNPIEIPVGSDVVQINSYYVDVTVNLTNRLAYTADGETVPMLMELPSGDYRLRIAMNDGNKDYIRTFTFKKEKSGDVRLHFDAPSDANANQKFLGYSKNVTINFKAVTQNGMAKSDTQVSRVSFNPSGFDAAYDADGNLVGTGVFTSGITDRSRYGTLPDFSKIDANERGNGALNLYSSGTVAGGNFVSLTGYRSVIDDSARATVSAPTIEINTYAAGTRVNGRTVNAGGYVVRYTFTVTAENGVNVGQYTHEYYFLNPTAITVAASKDGTALTGATDEMDKKESATYTLDMTSAALAVSPAVSNATKALGADVYVLSEVTNEDGTSSQTRTLVARVALDETGQTVVTPVGVGKDMDLPAMTLENGAVPNRLTVAFSAATTGGKYAFTPCYRFGGSLSGSASAAADSADYYVKLPAYVTVNRYNADGSVDSDAGKTDGFALSRYDNGDALVVEKVVSRYSTLRDMRYTTKPNGAVLEKYVAGNPTTISSLTDNPSVTGYSKLRYVSLSEIAPTNSTRPTAYRVVATYAAAEGDSAAMDSLSYATYVVMRVYGEKSPSYEPGYIDEFASVYAKSADGSVSQTPLSAFNTVYCKDAGGNDTADVDYVEYRVFLDEGERVSLRVSAENPLYYTDYDFVSYGPAKNKTFMITVDAPLDTPDGIYTIMLKTRIDGVYTRTVSMLFLVGGTDEYRAQETVVNGVTVYRKTYKITRNVSATYEAFISGGAALGVQMDGAGFNPDFTGSVSGAVTLTLDTKSDAFTLDGADAATVYVHLAVQPQEYSPDWGHVAFG